MIAPKGKSTGASVIWSSRGIPSTVVSSSIIDESTDGLRPSLAGYSQFWPRDRHLEQAGLSRSQRTLDLVQLLQAFLRGGARCFFLEGLVLAFISTSLYVERFGNGGSRVRNSEPARHVVFMSVAYTTIGYHWKLLS